MSNNEFIENLQKSVVKDIPLKGSLAERKESLEQALKLEEESVIKNPQTIEKLKKELANVEKEIKKEEAAKAVDNRALVGKAASEKDTDEAVKEEEVKDEKSLNEDEKDKDKAEELKKAYHDAMIALHEKKMKTIQRQKNNKELVSSKTDYEQELKLEAKLYEARNAYLELGKEDPFAKKRTELIKKEKEAKEPIEMELRNRAKRFRKIEEEIKEIDKREKEINEELLKKDISETQVVTLQQELGELGQKRKKLETELAEIKDNLDNAIETRRERFAQRAGLEKQHVETLSDEDKKNYDYQQSKVATMNKNFDQATKQHYENIKIRIEEREQKIKDINKELKDMPTTDFERRLVLLNELDKETNMLEADREAKSDLDRGIIPDSKEMAKDAKEKIDEEEYRQKEFDKATDEVRVVVERQKEEIGMAVVQNPTIANIEEKERDTTLKAATVAAAVDGPAPGPDTPLQDAKQFAVAKCVISGLEDKVRDPNNPEDAKAMVENDEQITKVNEELQKVQENIEEKVQ